ncbi:MAG: CDP-alcohol phosphatidyltransferase family protein [Gemmataceae bacterium]
MRWIVGQIPNALSLARVGLGLAFPWLPASWRIPVIVAAAVTDLLDGASGRFLHVTSKVGRILDPVADKIFVLAVVATLLWEDQVTLVEVGLVGLRDLTVIVAAVTFAATRKWDAFSRMAPTLLGKATTVAQFLYFLAVLAAPETRLWALVVTALLSAVAGAHYVLVFLYGRVRFCNKIG